MRRKGNRAHAGIVPPAQCPHPRPGPGRQAIPVAILPPGARRLRAAGLREPCRHQHEQHGTHRCLSFVSRNDESEPVPKAHRPSTGERGVGVRKRGEEHRGVRVRLRLRLGRGLRARLRVGVGSRSARSYLTLTPALALNPLPNLSLNLNPNLFFLSPLPRVQGRGESSGTASHFVSSPGIAPVLVPNDLAAMPNWRSIIR